jgi:hypothetical protein
MTGISNIRAEPSESPLDDRIETRSREERKGLRGEIIDGLSSDKVDCLKPFLASSAKFVGQNRNLTAAKRRELLESCPQQAGSRMGL